MVNIFEGRLLNNALINICFDGLSLFIYQNSIVSHSQSIEKSEISREFLHRFAYTYDSAALNA